MKYITKNKQITSILCAMVLLMVSAISIYAENPEYIEMHRLYNRRSGEHFYTGNPEEMNILIQCGWQYEGIGWYAPVSSGTPVYRLYNKSGGEHHYTMNVIERDSLIKYGWIDEGIGWYSDDDKGVPLNREYNPNAYSCNHNYTHNATEHEMLLSFGWLDEGCAWYGLELGRLSEKEIEQDSVLKERNNWGYGDYHEFSEYSDTLKWHNRSNHEKLPFTYGTKEALQVGSDPKLSDMPAPGYEDENGTIYTMFTYGMIDAPLDDPYYDGQHIIVRWFPKRYSYSEGLEGGFNEADQDMYEPNGIFATIKEKNLGRDISTTIQWGMAEIGPAGKDKVYENSYSVIWYAVSEESAYYDTEKNEVILP